MRRLKREVGLFDAVMINLGAIIGAGIFVVIGIASGYAGPAVTMAIVISAIISILTGLSFSRIARNVAKEGGVYEYAKEALSRYAGFSGGLMWIFGNIIALAAVALSLAGYLNALLGSSINVQFAAVGAILAFMVVNILGVKHSAKTVAALVVINVIVLVSFSIGGFTHFNPAYFSHFLEKGYYGVFEGAALIFFAFTGFSRVTSIGDEVVDPERTIPKAIIISICIATVLYLLVSVSAVGLIGPSGLASSSSPLSAAVSVLDNKWVDLLVAFGGVTATAGVTLTGILGTSRVFFAMGRDGELPKELKHLDRFATPINAILLSSAISIAFVLFLPFGTIVEVADAAVLISYAIINIAALKVTLYGMGRFRKAEKNVWRSAGISAAGLLSIIFIVSYLDPYNLFLTLLIMALVTVYYAFRKRNMARKGMRVFMPPQRSEVRIFGQIRKRI